MDSDDLVIIESEPPPSTATSQATLPALVMTRHDVDSDSESETDNRPVIHTNVPMRHGRYQYHNYLHDTNDNCAYCHDFLLQAYRERRLSPMPPPPPPIAVPVRCSGVFEASFC